MELMRSGRHRTAGLVGHHSHSITQLRAAHLLRVLRSLPLRHFPRGRMQLVMRPLAQAAAAAAQRNATYGDIRVAAMPRVATFNGLSGDDFRHPLDQQNTRLLRLLPGLEGLIKSLIGGAAETVLLLENMGSSVLEAAAILGVEPPELYVRQSPSANAFTLAVSGRRPFVVLHSALLELLTPLEVQSVLGHELGHLKCDHGVWLNAGTLVSSAAASLPFMSSTLEDGLLRWLRAAELTCDRAALLVAQDPRVVVSALMKLAGGSPSLAKELNVDAFLRQARSYDEVSASPLGFYLREIDGWAQSAQYQQLLQRNQRSNGHNGNGAELSSNGTQLSTSEIRIPVTD